MRTANSKPPGWATWSEPSLDAALCRIADADKAFAIGGVEPEAAPARTDELVLTEIERDFDGDAYFAAWTAHSSATRNAHATAQDRQMTSTTPS